ncbi:MAG TPA: hypothetical protein VGS80_02405, partial [Ktedonobacterales bacterium]|nr:hypothetical protein [Ktedonobacterales bacterium]
MTTAEPRPGSGAPAPAHAPESDGKPTEPYTGVVVIHGIGNEKRNATLQQALDALSYWFNHHAELD